MARKGGGFGFVMLLVVLAVVLLLTARAWNRVGTPAIDAAGTSRPGPPARGERAEAADALRDLPGLEAARQATDAHAQEVEKALETEDRGDAR
jgi:hypothetical protein